jgi:preprotein translocase subunit SecG
MSWWQFLVTLGIVGVCILLILVILIQKGRGGGLAGAFGGGGGGSAFGAKTGDVFTAITVVLAFVFLLLAVVGNYAFTPSGANAARSSTATAPPAMPLPETQPPPTGASEPAAPASTPGAAVPTPGETTGTSDQPARETPAEGTPPVAPEEPQPEGSRRTPPPEDRGTNP